MGRKKKVTWPAGEAAWRLYAERVGDTPRAHLEWALRQIESYQLTPADRENQRLEIAAFVARRQVKPVWTGVLEGSDEKVDAPTDKEVKQVLEGFRVMLTAAKERREVHIGQIKIRRVAQWAELPANKYVRYEIHDEVESDETWELRARVVLGRAIGKAGHLLKECPAPAPRGEPGDTCGTWFVAKRPNQEYCSATCQSRASTRAARTGTDTPVMVKRRTQEQAKMKKPKQRRASR